MLNYGYPYCFIKDLLCRPNVRIHIIIIQNDKNCTYSTLNSGLMAEEEEEAQGPWPGATRPVET